MSTRFRQHSIKSGLHNVVWILLIAASIILFIPSFLIAADLKLIDAAILKSNLGKWVILDARPQTDWKAGHIPGALLFSWERYTRTDIKGVEYSSFSPEELAIALSEMGIDERTPIVVYGDANKSWGSEGYAVWLLSWLGHKGPIRLLNGGIQTWRSRNFPLIKGSEASAVKKAPYRVNLQYQYIVSTEQVQKNKGSFVLVDVRSTWEWIEGRIPGSIHIPWKNFYTGRDHHTLPPAELKKLLAKHGVNYSRPVVYYCAAGVRSAYAWMTHQLAGLPGASNYKGSWAAWEKRSGQ